MPPMRLIQSPQNWRIRRVRALQTRRGRRRERCFVLEGVLLVEEALAAGAQLQEVFVCPELLGASKTEQLVQRLPPTAETFAVPEQLFRQLAETSTPQGIAAVTVQPEQDLDDTKLPAVACVVAAWGLRDPGNLGAIIRTAHAAGAAAVVTVGDSVDAFAGKVTRSSMGSVFHVSIRHAENLDRLCEWAQEQHLAVVAMTVHEGSAHYEVVYPERTLFVVGHETQGLPTELVEAAWRRVTIPMPGGAESLNAAVSASIVLYEFVRQRAARKSEEITVQTKGDEGEK